MERSKPPVEAAGLHAELEQKVAALEEERERRARLDGELVRAERVAAVGMLATGLAHEVNNPLACLLASLEVLDQHLDGSAEARSILADALDGARRVRDVVRQLGSFSPKADPGSPSVFDLRETIEAVARMARPTIRLRGRLSLQLPDSELLVSGWSGQLAQALLNLMLNATHALATDGRGRITVRAVEQGGGVEVEVHDDGCGIPAELLARVFEPGFSTKPAGEATGLGLPMAADVARAHGGTIEIESVVGAGTTVRLRLPSARAARTPAPPRMSSTPPARPRVLLVDDEPALLRALGRVLGREMDVTTADASAAISLLTASEATFDLVITDFVMPGIGGEELYRIVCGARPDLAGRIVLCSGAHHDHHLQRLADEEHLLVLAKPFGIAEVRRAMVELAERGRPARTG